MLKSPRKINAVIISDIHLSDSRPDISQCFDNFLSQVARTSRQLYILGDLFDVWVGDDDRSPLARATMDSLARLSDRGVDIYLQRGNRDFLLGKAFCRRVGAQLLPPEAPLRVGRHRILAMHGDLLCTDDKGYQRLRKCLHNPVSSRILLCLPLFVRHAIARGLRRRSKMAGQQKTAATMDVNLQTVADTLQRHGRNTLVHGHTHKPASHSLLLAQRKPGMRWVLGDWHKMCWWLELGGDIRLCRAALDDPDPLCLGLSGD